MGTFYTLPQVDLAGGVCSSAASAWGFGNWVGVVQAAEECSILGVTYQWTSVPGLDTTEEHLLEVGTTQSASDDFNRANGALGANWTTINNAMTIVSNAAAGDGGAANEGAAWVTDIGVDQIVSADITLPTGTGYRQGGVWVRNDGSALNGYFFGWDTSGDLYLQRADAGAFTTLQSNLTFAAANGTKRLRLEVAGTSLRAFYDDTLVLTGTTTNHASNVKAGINAYSDGTGTAGYASVDNFVATGIRTRLQFTSSHRPDTQVGYYLKTIHQSLPEPFLVPAGSQIAVRAADSSTSARTYDGIRLLIDRITPAGPRSYGGQINQAVQRSAVI